MKIQGEKYNTMATAIKAVVDSFGKDKIRQSMQHNKVKAAWAVWSLAADDMRYTDSHPMFKHRQRYASHNPTFDVYSDHVNDDHIETALFKILKDLLA